MKDGDIWMSKDQLLGRLSFGLVAFFSSLGV